MNILAIGAHPDDEINCSGTLAKLAAAGKDVYILTTTRGEGGSTGFPPLCAQENLGRLREAEGHKAGEILGVKEVIFLPYADPLPQNNKAQAIAATLEEFSAAIQQVLLRLRPELVLTHGSYGEYGHPQHIFTHQAVLHALRALQPWKPWQMLTWCADYPNPEVPGLMNKDDPADLLVDIQPWIATKLASFEAHKSQVEPVRRYFLDKGGAYMSFKVESFHLWKDYSLLYS
jgi:N-acetylglucosamine malate deacetylase 2